MTYTPILPDPEIALPLPITQSDRLRASQWASQQPTAAKAHQVRLNTLAVQVVQQYFQLLDIETDWAASDSANPLMQLGGDIADLVLPRLGRLECRPVLPGQSHSVVPPEVWDDRIGYVVVQIDESLNEAWILGFVPTVAAEVLPLDQLQPPEALLDHLADLQTAVTPALSRQTKPSTGDRPHSGLITLSHWIQSVVEEGWQTVESLLNPPEMGFAFRDRGLMELPDLFNDSRQETVRVRRAKRINLGIQLADQPIALIVDIHFRNRTYADILLQLYPAGLNPCLPEAIQLAVLDGDGQIFLETTSRDIDNFIQLQLNGEAGERFDVCIQWRDITLVERFMI